MPWDPWEGWGAAGLRASGKSPGQGRRTDIGVLGLLPVGPFGEACTPLPSPRAASGPTALFRNTKAAGAAIGGVKNMLLEWCRAMTRNYEVGTERGPMDEAGDPYPGRWCWGGPEWC